MRLRIVCGNTCCETIEDDVQCIKAYTCPNVVTSYWTIYLDSARARASTHSGTRPTKLRDPTRLGVSTRYRAKALNLSLCGIMNTVRYAGARNGQTYIPVLVFDIAFDSRRDNNYPTRSDSVLGLGEGEIVTHPGFRFGGVKGLLSPRTSARREEG